MAVKKHFSEILISSLLFLLYASLLSCSQSAPSKKVIGELKLKSGDLISCGPPDKEFGRVSFDITGTQQAKNDFNIALALLHSFEYDEAEKVFTKIIHSSPGCAMAYWGIAMSNFHSLWEPPAEAEIKKGSKAIEIANTISDLSARESDYIQAIASYYSNWEKTDPRTRNIHYETAMEQLFRKYPDDQDAAVFYALALVAAADGTDKTYSRQKKAGAILQGLYEQVPNHPGIVHYMIHAYDYPGIASFALPAARRYASVAPSSAHALHMPSHIFTRLGLWDDCISSNIASVAAAKCYAESLGIKGHWDEELHGLDYLVYAYLQKGENKAAADQLKYLQTIVEVFPINFKEAYTFAAAPSRMYLENKNWRGAAAIQLEPQRFPWKNFPWQEAIHHFTRLLGAAHIHDTASAQFELTQLNVLSDTLQSRGNMYQAKQVAVQIKTGEAWLNLSKGNTSRALALMSLAADMEDSTSKHPVTPGEVLPARELLADMLLELNRDKLALQAYEQVLANSPNRFNSLYGAGIAAERSGLTSKAVSYYKQLIIMIAPTSNRPEILLANNFLKDH